MVVARSNRHHEDTFDFHFRASTAVSGCPIWDLSVDFTQQLTPGGDYVLYVCTWLELLAHRLSGRQLDVSRGHLWILFVDDIETLFFLPLQRMEAFYLFQVRDAVRTLRGIYIHTTTQGCIPILCNLPYQAPSTLLRVRTYVHTYIHAYISTYIHTYCHRSICIKYIVLLTLCSLYLTHQPTNLSLHSRKLTNQLIHIVIDTHPISQLCMHTRINAYDDSCNSN